jgi:hypothetical protein
MPTDEDKTPVDEKKQEIDPADKQQLSEDDLKVVSGGLVSNLTTAGTCLF